MTALALLAGCAGTPQQPPAAGTKEAPGLRLPAAQFPAADCRPELDKVKAQLQAEMAERQRLVRAAARREEALKKQLDALKAIERDILDREERMHTQAR